MQAQETTNENKYNSVVVFAHWGADRVRITVQNPWINENSPNEWKATLMLLGTGSVSVSATAKPVAMKENTTKAMRLFNSGFSQ